MADSKNTSLSITLSAIDHATAPIRALNERLDHLTKPVNEFKKQLGELSEKSGLSSVVEGFKGVGDAVKETLFKFLEVGVVIGEVIHLMFELVNTYEELGKKAERIGVSVDFLAGMRDAAERSGASIEQLDEGLETFSVNLGKARAGTGRMVKFLEAVSPALLSQVKASKSTAQAFDLISDAMAKVTDPAKRAALAQMTVGDKVLAPLLAKGSKGIKELRDHYVELAGSQDGAATAAGEVHESMLDLKATTDGLKAALVEGLSPALKQLVEELQAFFRENRERIAEWAKDLGQKLPGAIHSFVEGFLGAIDSIASFVDSIGGIKTVGLAIAAVIMGPLLSSITTLGVALLTTPFGLFLAGIAGIIAALTHLKEIKDWALGDMSERLGNIADKAKKEGRDVRIDEIFTRPAWATGQQDATPPAKDAIDATKAAAEAAIDDLKKAQRAPQPVQVIPAGGGELQRTKVEVDFKNVPKGTRVKTESTGGGDVDVTMGLQLWGLS